jgi:hypothetical protein
MKLSQAKIESFKTNIETRKGGLYKTFSWLSEKFCRNLINKIKTEISNTPLSLARNEQVISKGEYEEFLKRIGYWD